MILKDYLKRVMPSLSSVVFVLAWFAIAPLVRAVVPAPDGGYPEFNTAEGQNALFNLTTGVGNTAVGWFSLWSDTDGSYNTAVGAGTLLFNVGNQSTGEGAQNTAIGTAALLNNTTGSFNTATGSTALVNNTEGVGNTAVGGSALFSNITGISNTAVGDHALFSNNGDPSFGDGSYNCAFGAFALIAEEVAEVNPDLVGRNPEGQPESVRYEQINAMLLNEFLKEHGRGEEQDCKIREQETTIAELRSEMKALAARINEQASQLQKVSAQLQINNAPAQAIAEYP